jgi:hypothetical protein
MTVESFLAYLTALVAFSLTGLLIVLFDIRAHRRFDPLNPGLAFLGLYTIYNFLAFCDDWHLQRAGASQYLFLATLGLLGVMTGTVLAYAMSCLSRRQPASAVVPIKPLFFVALILTPLCVGLLVLMYILRVGSLGALLALDSAGRALSKGGLLSGAFTLLVCASGLGLATTWRMERFWKWIGMAVFFSALFFVFYVAASRGELLAASLIAIYLYHYNVRRISVKVVTAGLTFLILLMVLLGIARARQSEGISGMLEHMTPPVVVEHLDFRRLEPYPAMLRGMNLLLDGPPGGQRLYGASYLWAVEILLPQSLYPFPRPLTLEGWYVNTYDPYTAAIGGGYNFPPLVESYWNFGAPGCFLVYALLAWVFNSIHLRNQKTQAGSVARICLPLLIPGFILLVQSPFSTYLKGSFFLTFLPGWLLCLLILTLFGPGKSVQWMDASSSPSDTKGEGS